MSKDMKKIDAFVRKNRGRKVVVVQGLGFVGAAMATAIASAKNKNSPLYAVIGVDLTSSSAYEKVNMVNKGIFPIKSADNEITGIFARSFRSGNIIATFSKYAYRLADFVVINIGLDVRKSAFGKRVKYSVILKEFINSIREIAKLVKPSCLVIVESTVPPGMCEKILLPMFKAEFIKRGFDPEAVNLAYSYERVMPGKDYFKSITSYYRVYSGINETSKRRAKLFLSSMVNIRDYPLVELDNITDAEMGKVLENSYRALNIAFIQEWTEFAESAKVDLFRVIDAIRMRQTHKNIMSPGFGVGGYCLTKDPLLADWSNKRLFLNPKKLGMSLDAVNINDWMPLYSFNLLKKHLKGIRGKKLLVMGVSYRKDIADTRLSPSAIFYKNCLKHGAKVGLYDPLVDYWPEFDLPVLSNLKERAGAKADAMIFAVDHDQYLKMGVSSFTKLVKPHGLILDCNNVINDRKARILHRLGFKLVGVGKGHWDKF